MRAPNGAWGKTDSLAERLRAAGGILATLLLLVAMGHPALSLLAQAQSPPQTEEPGKDLAPRYGKTPDSAIPFRNFQEPYLRFFQEPMPYRGLGRELAAKDSNTVRIGFFGPLGDVADGDVGQLMLEGTQLALEQANEDGGHEGRPFELVLRPDLGLWGATSNEMVSFKYEDDVVGVLGSIDGANTHIALRVALKIAMPMVNTGSTDPTLTETNIPWLLRCMADDRQQCYALAHHIFHERGLEKIVAFRVNDRYGRMGIREFRDAARRLGHPLRGELRWNRGEREFDRQLDRIQELDPEAIVIWANASDAAAVVKAIRARGMDLPLFGPDRLATDQFLEAAGELAEGIVAAASFDPTRREPRWTRFVDEFTARFEHAPEAFAAHAYDGTRILLDCVRRAGTNRVLVRDELYRYQQYEGVTGLIEFDTTLNDVGEVYLAEVKNGRLEYRAVDFSLGAAPEPRPYRTLREAAPEARSPERVRVPMSDPVRIGCFVPMDESGEAVVRGMRAAFEERTGGGAAGIVLVARDARAAWGGESGHLVEMVMDEGLLAIVGSTERKGTHLAEMLSAKMHIPIVSLCAGSPSVTSIPLPWIFSLAPEARVYAVDPYDLGYDAGGLIADCVGGGGRSRRALRDRLAALVSYPGSSGSFRFDGLGNRVELGPPPSPSHEPATRGVAEWGAD